MKLVESFLTAFALASASVHVVGAVSLRATSSTADDAAERNLQALDAPAWPPSYIREYRTKFPDSNFRRCYAFLEKQGITDPVNGTTCHKRTMIGDYSCLIGEQTCDSVQFETTTHPTKICMCDVASGTLTCQEWNPCGDIPLPTPPAVVNPVEPMPQPVWTKPSYWGKYKRAFTEANFQQCLFLEKRGITDPKEGDRCHRRQVDYTCAIGSQTCDSDLVPTFEHPTKTCKCDVASGRFTECSEWDPCVIPEETQEEIFSIIGGDSQHCDAAQSCRECLVEGCGWAFNKCVPECSLIADIGCYQGDAEAKCSEFDSKVLDSTTCREASADCETCTNTMTPSSGTPCKWIDHGSGNTACASLCGMMGCGAADGACPAPDEPMPDEAMPVDEEPILEQLPPPEVYVIDGAIAVDGRPFTDYEGTTKMADALQSDMQPIRWSASAEGEEKAAIQLSQSRRSELADEWKHRAVGEHSSIASFAAFAIALMTNQAPPDLVQASLVAAMDELRHAQTSFEMASLLSGSTIEPSALPASQHDFQENLTTLAAGVAKEGCVDETLSALVLAASVDQIQQGDDAADPTMKFLAEKTTQIAKEEGSHSVLAWRTIHWVCSMDGEEACAEVLNKWFERSHLEASGEARLESSDSSINAWTFIYQQLVPLVTKSEAMVGSGNEILRLEEGSLVASLANDIVNGVRLAIAAPLGMQTTSSMEMNCSGTLEENEASSLPNYLAAASTVESL